MVHAPSYNHFVDSKLIFMQAIVHHETNHQQNYTQILINGLPPIQQKGVHELVPHETELILSSNSFILKPKQC